MLKAAALFSRGQWDQSGLEPTGADRLHNQDQPFILISLDTAPTRRNWYVTGSALDLADLDENRNLKSSFVSTT